MADDVTKRIIWNFSSTGADKVADDLNKINDEQQKLAVNTDKVTKSSLDLEQSFDKLERRFDSQIRAEQDYEKVQQQVNAAVAQHPELQERANNVLEKAQAYFEKAGSGASAYEKALDKAREVMTGFAVEGGALGGLLGSFGPWGVAAAAGIGLVTKAMEVMKEGATKFGEVSSRLKDFSDNTGLTVDQMRALTEAGGQFGVSADQVGTAMQKFTANLQAAHQGSGELYDQLRTIDRGLADEVAASHGSAEAFDILTKAMNAATDATTKLNIAKAAFGKGSAGMVGAAGAIGDAGGLNAFTEAFAKASGLSSELIEKTATLSVQIKNLKEENERLMQSLYAEPVLERMKQAEETQNRILKTIKQMQEQQPGQVGMGEGFGGAGTQAEQEYRDAVEKAAAAEKEAAQASDMMTEALNREKAATQQAAQAKEDYKNKSITQASQSAKNVAALGEAATAEERAQARIDALTASFANGEIAPNIYARAIANVRDQLAGLQGNADAVAASQSILGTVMQVNAGRMSDQALAAQDSAKAVGYLGNLMAENTGKANAFTNGIEVQGKVLYDNSKSQAELAEQQRKTAERAREQAAAAREAARAAEQQAAAAKAAADANFAWQRGLAAAYQGLIQIAGAPTTMSQLGVPYAPNYTGATMPVSATMYGNIFGQYSRGATSGIGTVQVNGNTYLDPYGINAAYQSQEKANQAAYASQSIGDYIDTIIKGGGLQTGLAQAMAMPATGGRFKEADIESEVQSLYSTLNQGASQAGQISNTQAELQWLQSRPASAAQQKAIADLTQSLQSLQKSTDSLNATNQDLLSPYYTQDPRTSHIGFRSQGMAQGGYVDVPGATSANDNMIAVVPVASGERIYVDPMYSRRGISGGANFTINVSSPVLFAGNPNKDEVGRTMYQNNQNLVKQLRSAMQ